MINILHGSALTENVLNWMIYKYFFHIFLQCRCAKNYENRLTHIKVMNEKGPLSHSVSACTPCIV